MESALIIGGASADHKRHEMDFYPTPAECTQAIMDFLALPKGTDVWEPACGDGAISTVMASYGLGTVYSTDLRIDSGFGVGGVNFLTADKLANVVITNPPFNLAEQFIRRCYDLKVETYAMLLKTQYWHSKSRTRLFVETKPSFILPLTWRPNFAPNRGSSPTMDMIWTVWIAGSVGCKYVPLEKPKPKSTNTIWDNI